MNEQVISRHSICADADRAAQRFCEAHVEQPNPHLEGTEAHAWWQAQYVRMKAFYMDPVGDCEGSA